MRLWVAFWENLPLHHLTSITTPSFCILCKVTVKTFWFIQTFWSVVSHGRSRRWSSTAVPLLLGWVVVSQLPSTGLPLAWLVSLEMSPRTWIFFTEPSQSWNNIQWRRARNMSKMTQGLSQENLGSHLSLPSSWARGSRFKDVQGEEKPDQSWSVGCFFFVGIDHVVNMFFSTIRLRPKLTLPNWLQFLSHLPAVSPDRSVHMQILASGSESEAWLKTKYDRTC